MQVSSHKSVFYPAKLVSYDPNNRTAMVTMQGLTDGVPDGIPAMLAYPIGDDDLDTERELIKGADVWVFFEQGDTTKPVIAFYRRHGQGKAEVGTRRIRQENIELLARTMLKMIGQDLVQIEGDTVTIKASQINLDGQMNFTGNISHKGSQKTSGDVVASGKSLVKHTHIGNKGRPTSTPN